MVACVYILANKKNGTLYIGISTTLIQRVYQHKTKAVKSFTSKYKVDKLVYYETFIAFLKPLPAKRSSKNGNGPGKLLL